MKFKVWMESMKYNAGDPVLVRIGNLKNAPASSAGVGIIVSGPHTYRAGGNSYVTYVVKMMSGNKGDFAAHANEDGELNVNVEELSPYMA